MLLKLRIFGLRDAHELRTRRMGSQVFGDIHAIVDSKINVSEEYRSEIQQSELQSQERFHHGPVIRGRSHGLGLSHDWRIIDENQ